MTSLLAQSYKSIKNPIEKQYASYIIISSSLHITDNSIKLLEEKTKQKKIHVDSSDRMGSHITFILQKQTGRIVLTFHKKRSFLCSVMFQTIDKQLLDQVNYKSKSLDKLLVEIIMYEFPYICRNYIKNGMKKKTSIVKKLVCDLVQYNSNLNIHCDINNKRIVDLCF